MSVHSADRIENTGKTKLERLSERAENRKETVFNNLGHLIDRDLLKQMYYRIDGNKAIGMDGIHKEIYGRQLDENIDNLIKSIRRGTYRPKPARLVEIPKEDGSTRPLAISCFEDKLVQMAVSEILTRIYEPLFLPCSFGYRPGRSCHDALCALMEQAYPCWNGAIAEIDIQKYFNSIPHVELKEILKKKISDERFLRLIDKLATTPICDKGNVVANTIGCPQGSIISPILANIYLHEVIDCWFEEIKSKHLRGSAHEVRYADDMVFVFEKVDDAENSLRCYPSD